MQRILIVGQSGTGKSTLACMLASGLGLPWSNADQMVHNTNGTACTEQEFAERLKKTIEQPNWIIDCATTAMRPETIAKADTVIWLDYSAPCTAFRFARRSAARLRDGEKMSGEPRSPNESFTSIAKDIYWSSSSFLRRQKSLSALYGPMFDDHTNELHLKKIRLTSPAQAIRLLENLGIPSRPTKAQKREARRVIPTAPV